MKLPGGSGVRRIDSTQALKARKGVVAVVAAMAIAHAAGLAHAVETVIFLAEVPAAVELADNCSDCAPLTQLRSRRFGQHPGRAVYLLMTSSLLAMSSSLRKALILSVPPLL
jgi:hypothetical protein